MFVSVCKRYLTTHCHPLSTNLRPLLKSRIGVNPLHFHIFWVPARYLCHMTAFVRTPSPDGLVEHLVLELQKTGTRCETAHNFNNTYPDAKRTSFKWR